MPISRQLYDVYYDDHFYARISAFSAKQAKFWFAKTYAAFTKDRIEVKPAKPVEIAKDCSECGYICSEEANECPNCDSVL